MPQIPLQTQHQFCGPPLTLRDHNTTDHLCPDWRWHALDLLRESRRWHIQCDHRHDHGGLWSRGYYQHPGKAGVPWWWVRRSQQSLFRFVFPEIVVLIFEVTFLDSSLQIFEKVTPPNSRSIPCRSGTFADSSFGWMQVQLWPWSWTSPMPGSKIRGRSWLYRLCTNKEKQQSIAKGDWVCLETLLCFNRLGWESSTV